MLKLTKTGIGLLTKQYRSVLRKCLLLNFIIILEVSTTQAKYSLHAIGTGYGGRTFAISDSGEEIAWGLVPSWTEFSLAINSRYTKSEVQNIQSLNYYYTFRVDERDEAIDSASFFQKDFSTLQKVDLQSKNLTHLRAFSKCDEVCPRPSERFALSLSQEQMFKNDASVDAGTFSICSLQIENVNEKLSNVFEA